MSKLTFDEMKSQCSIVPEGTFVLCLRGNTDPTHTRSFCVVVDSYQPEHGCRQYLLISAEAESLTLDRNEFVTLDEAEVRRLWVERQLPGPPEAKVEKPDPGASHQPGTNPKPPRRRRQTKLATH